MPIIEAPPGATRTDIADLDNMAQEYKAGERGGGAVPYQTRLRLVGTEGSIPDTIGSIRFHNEEMARSMLMMFMQLGQTQTGSRALGQSFIDWFAEQQVYIADWVVAITVQYVIEDWWNWNVDPSAEQTPTLGYIKDAPTVADFAGAQLPPEATAPPPVSAGQGRGGRPAPSRPTRPLRAADPALTPSGNNVSPSAMPPVGLPMGRKLRRQPYPHEIAAGVDFGALDEDMTAGQVDAEVAWAAERAALTGQIRDAIAGATADNVVEVVAAAGQQAAAEAAAALQEAGLGNVAAAAAAEAAFAKVIASTAQAATGRARDELIKQGLLQAADYGGTKMWVVGDKGIGLASDHLISLRNSLVGDAQRLTARVKDGYSTMDDLASKVYEDLLARQDVTATDQIKGMINATVNQSRMDVFGDAEEDGVRLYASELLDANTCGACINIDGEQLSQDQAFELYAGGGYIDCDGGPRCRGTVVAVYEGERSY
jgi:hypothetical protein